MNVSGKVPHTIDRLKELLKKLGLLYLDNAKLTVTEKLTELVSAGVMLIVTLVLGIFGIAFLSGACIELLALMLPVWACYLIMGGAFLWPFLAGWQPTGFYAGFVLCLFHWKCLPKWRRWIKR